MIEVFIAIASTLVWAVPPFKHYNTKYFPFFIVNAFAGPSAFLAAHVFQVQLNNFYPAYYFFMLSMLIGDKLKKYSFVLGVFSLFVFPILRPIYTLQYVLLMFIDLIIIAIILMSLFDDFIKANKINLFVALLFVYFAVDIVKIFDVTVYLGDAYVYYYLGVIVQIAFGIAFWFINVHTKSFKMRMAPLVETDE